MVIILHTHVSRLPVPGAYVQHFDRLSMLRNKLFSDDSEQFVSL